MHTYLEETAKAPPVICRASLAGKPLVADLVVTSITKEPWYMFVTNSPQIPACTCIQVGSVLCNHLNLAILPKRTSHACGMYAIRTLKAHVYTLS